MLALDDADEEREGQEDRQPVAEPLEGERAEGAGREDRHAVPPLAPAQARQTRAAAAEHGHGHPRHQQQQREGARKVRGAGIREGAERQAQPPALLQQEQCPKGEPEAGGAVDGHGTESPRKRAALAPSTIAVRAAGTSSADSTACTGSSAPMSNG